MIRRLLRRFTDSRLGDRIKAATGIRPPKHIRPWNLDETVSDLFPWRIGDGWETRFDLMNIPSLTTPDHPTPEQATVVIFDDIGKEVCRHTETLAPFKTTRLDIGAVVAGAGIDPLGEERIGSFAVFHAMGGAGDHMKQRHSYLTERGYVAYRRAGDALWSYVHGNTYALSKRGDGDDVSSMTAHVKGTFTYRPQLVLDDARGFELVYINPLSRATTLTVRLMDSHRRVLHTVEKIVPGLGVFVIGSADLPANIPAPTLVEADSGTEDWRPVVFKHHNSHFDVMHS